MANYNTFLVQSTKGKNLMVTSSARKASRLLAIGIRVEVWSNNAKIKTIYHRTRRELDDYISAERAYIRAKQAAAEQKNKTRRGRPWSR